MKAIYGENVLAVINNKKNDRKTVGQFVNFKDMYFNGDVDDAVRSIIVAEVEGKVCCCFCEHYANYYFKKFEINESIKI